MGVTFIFQNLMFITIIMVRLDATVIELWPDKAQIILKEKDLSVPKLKKHFSKIFFPWDQLYNNYRFFFKLQVQELPLFVIVPQCIEEVRKSLNLAYLKNITLRVMAGRHSSNVIDPNFYVDMSEFRSVKLNGNTLSAGGGINQGSIYNFLAQNESQSQCHFTHGSKMCHPFYSHAISRLLKNTNATNDEFMFPGGSAGSVCISGFTTGGGSGSYRRTFGLAIDNVKSYEIVVPPTSAKSLSKVRHVCKDSAEDLFWALSGGVGSNFGIVTEIKFKLREINSVVMYSIVWPWEQAKEVMELWLRTAPRRPSNYNEDISMYASGNNIGIEMGGLYVVPDSQTDRQAVRAVKHELRIHGGTLKTRVVSYPDSMVALAAGRIYHPFSSTKIFFSSNIIDIDYVIDKMNSANKNINALYLFGIELLGGKIADKSSEESAFYPRSAKFFYESVAYCESSLDYCYINGWSTSIFNHIYDPHTDNVFVGFPIPGLKNHMQAYYGKNKQRLIQIKKQIDPSNVMRYPQGIPE